MTAITFPLSNAPGEHPQEAAGRLENCYAVPMGEGARAEAVIKRVPGIAQWGASGLSGYRGGQAMPGAFYGGFDGKIVRFTADGTPTVVGNLAGTTPLIWARNNNATPQLVAVDPTGNAYQVQSGSVIDYPDADIGSPNSVCFLMGFWVFSYGSALIRVTGLNTTDINTNDFATAESKTDGLLRVIPWNGQLFAFGDYSAEVWDGSNINTEGFPFNRVTVIQRGLWGRYAIAGHEDGFGKALAWVGEDGAVYVMDGYTPSKVSPPDLDRLISRVTDRDTLQATVYVADGIPRWVLSSPEWTWEFNLNSLKWNERKSHLMERWRGTACHYAFGKWLVGDTESGNVGAIDPAARQEFGAPLRFRAESANIAKFPARAAIAAIDLDITTGVGIATGNDPNETDPIVEISVQRDGVNWTVPRMVKMGRQAVAKQRVRATRFGLSGPKGARVRVDVTDAVHVGLMGGEMLTELRP